MHGWTIVRIKDDWKTIFPPATKRAVGCHCHAAPHQKRHHDEDYPHTTFLVHLTSVSFLTTLSSFCMEI
jgi:hypothetical protein